jgi:phosphoserine phosphatase RsbU/P
MGSNAEQALAFLRSRGRRERIWARTLMDFEKPDWLTQMEEILETLNEGVMVADDCHRIMFVNSAFVEMTGIEPGEVLGVQPSQFYSFDEWQFLKAQIELAERAGHHRYGFVLPKSDGTRLPVIISSRALEDPDGRTFGIITFTDISEQKEQEQQLRALNTRLETRQREIDEDLALAARVQKSLAPASLLWGNVRVESFYHPVHSIGGDFALVSPFGEEYLTLLVCDVSGHGIGSALVATRIYTEAMTQLRRGTPPADMLRELNHFVLDSIDSSGFLFTAATARIDRAARRMSYAGAGHPPAMIARAGQEPIQLESRSMILGALPDAVDDDANMEVELCPGDRVVMYTDGITDVFNASGKILGISGVQEFVHQTSTLPFGEMKQGIMDRVTSYSAGPLADDVSLVLVEIQ